MQRDPGLFHTGRGVWKTDVFGTKAQAQLNRDQEAGKKE
jgi:hypothetical protein